MSQTVKRRRIKLKEGDVLQLDLPDRRVGYAVVVDRGSLPSGGTPYIAVFGSAYAGGVDSAKLAKDTLALAGWTTDALVYHEVWRIVAHGLPVPALPLPNFKIEQERRFYVTDFRGEYIDLATPAELDLLDYQSSFTAGIFQDAFEALHGFGEWKDHYRKLTVAHAAERMTRPTPPRA